MAGASPHAAIRAAALAAGGAIVSGAVVWYLREIVEEPTWTDPDPPPPTDPPEPPRPFVPPLSDEWGAEDLAAELYDRNYAVAALTQDVADDIARQCTRLAARAGMVPQRECLDRPLFAPGSDTESATNHDLAAILDPQSPQPFALQYQTPSHSRDWLSSPAVAAVCPSPRPSGKQCDEYPFASTVQGGQANNPSLHLVDSADNMSQGTKLGAFYTACGLRTTGTGTPFLVVPTPPHLGIPTLALCNHP